uniref:Fucosyltransferase n=1 Tax=Oryza punctata TaxID=4537 RepID=A0A0E0L992_ORYPU
MRRHDATIGGDGAAAPWKEEQLASHRWPEAQEGAPAFPPPMRRLVYGAANVALVVFIMTVPPMVVLYGARASLPAVWISSAIVGRGLTGDNSIVLHRPAAAHDKLLGGLLADGFDEGSCHSRYQSAVYRRNNAGKEPSPHLVFRLRRHEELQRGCGPGTVAYSNAVESLRSGKSGGIVSPPECRYLVSISYRGLGNRMLAASSALLYAMLTDRVLLVDPSNEMGELFCEPFPGTTWLLPPDFPLTNYTNFSVDTAESYGNMLKNNMITTDAGDVPTPHQQLPAFAYIHLDHDYTFHDKFFFCDDDQSVLRNIPWLVMRTDCYIVPGLFLVTGFQEELDMLFPETDTVFHHLARYLFHPNNHIWGLVTRYYDAYLATARQRVGVQVRVFGARQESPKVLEQITKCTQKENLLPDVIAAGEPPVVAPATRRRRKPKAVLVTSLTSWYSEKLKSTYWEHATITGEAVSVHQPSHEEYQRFGSGSHDAKALAEMYLLSLSDALVTSGWSTFGYVAQGLAGLTPWVMYKPANESSAVPDPPCRRDVSMEPCFLTPPYNNCRMKRSAHSGKVVAHVQNCHDVPWGLKLVHRVD